MEQKEWSLLWVQREEKCAAPHKVNGVDLNIRVLAFESCDYDHQDRTRPIK